MHSNRMVRNWILISVAAWLLAGCAASKPYNPSKKYHPGALQQDYTVFRGALEEAHPSLYWYTPKDSLDYYFDVGRGKLSDSLTEQQFRNVLSYVVAKIRCGHTSVRPSNSSQRGTMPTGAYYPIYVKAWPDTVLVTANVNPRDSVLVPGVILKSINSVAIEKIIDSFFQHISSDGFNETHRYQTLSNGSSFRNYYAALYGLKRSVPVTFLDTAGILRSDSLRAYRPPTPDSALLAAREKISKKELKQARLRNARSLRYDTTGLAIMEVNGFGKKSRLRSFLRQSFRELDKRNTEHLVLDLRANGGGSVLLSNLLTKYLADKPFKIADSLYATRRWSKWGKYRDERLANWAFLNLLTCKKADGNYHFYWVENRHFKPKRRNHFDGKVYVLTGGNTFSAATLVTKALKGQSNVTVVGEETGGGAYGNTAWRIPEVILPNTGVRVRLPLFRLVIDKETEFGRGVMPDVEAGPSVDSIRRRRDYKMDKVRQLIGR